MSTKISNKQLKAIEVTLEETTEQVIDGDITLSKAGMIIRACRVRIKAHTEDRLRNGSKLK